MIYISRKSYYLLTLSSALAMMLSIGFSSVSALDNQVLTQKASSITEKVHTLSVENRSEYIIVFKGVKNSTVVESYGGIINRDYKSLPMVTASLTNEMVNELKNDTHILSVEPNAIAKSLSTQQLDWGMTNVKAPNAWSNGYTGKNVRIAVLDSGIDMQHEDLTVAGGVSFVKGNTSYDDDNGHGTHVAGIIAARDNSVGVKGVAPNAEIYAVKVLSNSGSGTLSDILAGIDWAMQNKMDIINMSLGLQSGDTALQYAVDQAYAKGILVVAAAGNDGMNATTGAIIPYSASTDLVNYPAKYTESVIAVGAIDSNNNRAVFSSFGSEVEIAAPGQYILSSIPKDMEYNCIYTSTCKLEDYESDGSADGYTKYSGTSMATPYVTGVLALMKEAYPLKTNVQIRQMLDSYATDLGVIGKDNQYGYGLAQANFPASYYSDKIAPSVPQNVKGFSNGSDFILSWNKVPDADLYGYNVYENGIKLNTNTIGNETFTLHGVASYTNHTFTVVAVDRSGNISSASSPITVTWNQPIGFYDVSSSHWAYSDIQWVAKQGWIRGTTDTQFSPDGTLTRAQAAAIISRSLGLVAFQSFKNDYNDINSSFWAYKDIELTEEYGIFHGFPDGGFHPNDPVTREQIAVILTNTVASGSYYYNDHIYTDMSYAQNTWSYPSVAYMNSKGLMGGFPDGSFHPHDSVSRAQMSSLMKRAAADLASVKADVDNTIY